MIELRGVEKSLGGRQILAGLDLVAPSSEITYLIGPSGAGKSVVARHASGIIHPDRGSVHVFGERIDALSEEQLRRLRQRCVFVLQGAALLDERNLLENVSLGAVGKGLSRKAARKRAWELLERLELSELAESYPAELSPAVLMQGAVARALALEPEMIIYDEPTSGLEPGAARLLDGLLMSMRDEGIGALVISHDVPSILKVPDTIHLLHAGRIHLKGPPELFRVHPDPVVRQFVEGKAEGPLPQW